MKKLSKAIFIVGLVIVIVAIFLLLNIIYFKIRSS